MKHNKFSEEQKQKMAGGSRLTAAEDLIQSKIDFATSSDEVAKRAYFTYVNQVPSLAMKFSTGWMPKQN